MTCPACAVDLDLHWTGGADARPPRPGDYLVCFNCGAISRVNAGDTLHHMSRAELAALPEPVLRGLALESFRAGMARAMEIRARAASN